MGDAKHDRTVRFLKPANDKAFPAKIYRATEDFSFLDAYGDDLPTLESDVVPITDEYRFCVPNENRHLEDPRCFLG